MAFKAVKQDKLVLSNTSAKIVICALAINCTYGAYNGLYNVINNPQLINNSKIQQIYNLGYNHETYQEYADNSAYINGLFTTLISLVTGAVATTFLYKPVPKSERITPIVSTYAETEKTEAQLSQQAKVKSENEQFKELKHELLDGFLYVMLEQHPFIMQNIQSKCIVLVGEGGAGKSRLAMIIALCMLIYNGNYESAIDILDTQRASKNIDAETWMAGNVHTTTDTIDSVFDQERSLKSPFSVIVMDEIAKLMRFPEYQDTAIKSLAKVKEEIRSENRSVIYTCHLLQTGEWNGQIEDQEKRKMVASLRTAMLRSATIMYLPNTTDDKGKNIKSPDVFVRNGYTDDIRLPFRVGRTDRFTDTETWEHFSIATELDPSEFAKRLHMQVAALRLNPVIVKSTKVLTSTPVKNVYGLSPDMLADRIKATIGDVKVGYTSSGVIQHKNISEVFGDDLREYVYTELQYNQFSDIAKRFFDMVDEYEQFIEVAGVNVLELNAEFYAYFSRLNLNKLDLLAMLRSLSDLNIGKLSNDNKYWLHPKSML